MGTPASTPKTPMLVSVIVPSRRSAGAVRPARAVAVRSASALVSPRRVSSCASLMFGTTSPRGPATAMPRWTYRFVTTSSDVSSQDEFREGCSCRARTTARATTARGVTWSPSKRRLCRSRSTSSTVDVASTVRKTQACGAVATLRAMASAMCFWTPRTGALVSRSLPSRAADPARCAARSSRVMIPPGPLPFTSARSTPCCRAMKRTGGAASGRAGVACCAGGSGGGDPLPVPAAVAAPAARRRLGRAVADQHRHLLLGADWVGGCGLGLGGGDGVDGDERGPDADRLPRCGQELDDGAGEGAGQLDDGLLGLHLHQDLVQGHLVPDGDVPRHDLGFGEPFTEVGQDEVLQGAHDGWRQRSTSWRIRSASGRK